ncbi:hypothetical protein [Subtercola frigoramans]|uniref:DUF4386 domain-containing protein n=1 Tax=Subtercola frigoramans TaxID=120298 RepID=A0ABS2L1A2_9MICO|nr:hypothetical protein [Subtercola frigoramans]MBM7470860.1 hypothetical protein [Subtercola frigoramans]
MKTPDVRRWTGISALAVAGFLALEVLTKLTIPGRPELDAGDALVQHSKDTAVQTIIVILADTFLMAFLIVFFSCFRQLVTAVRHDLRWIADITFASGIVFISVTLVGDSMDGGAALDALGLAPDPSAIRTLIVGHSIMFGSTGAVLLALFSATAAYLTFASGVVPRWTGILASATALSNLAWAIVGFNGTSPNHFFAVGGIGNALLAIFPWLLWVVCVGITTIRGARHGMLRSGAPIGAAPVVVD